MENRLFETEKVYKAFFKLTLPVVLGMIITIVYNMVDTWFVAMTGNTALVAGVSVVGPLLYIMIALGFLCFPSLFLLFIQFFILEAGDEMNRKFIDGWGCLATCVYTWLTASFTVCS